MNGINIEGKSAEITLEQLGVRGIPDSFWGTEGICQLTIQKVKADKWVVYPPFSWFENREIKPPFWTIPIGIANLTQLQELHLVELDIAEIPDSITELQELRVLNLSLNKLHLSNELDKFRRLKSLEHLILVGNHYDADEMISFQQEFPDIKIEFRGERN